MALDPQPTQPYRILVIAADEVKIQCLGAVLQRTHFRLCASFTSGSLAVNHSQSYAPDVAIVDLALPEDFDAVETVRVLRDRFNIPVVLMTDADDAESLARADSLGDVTCLYLPLGETQLKQAVIAAMYRHCSEQHAELLAAPPRIVR
ncbi:MAG: response regulator [Gammaproteobacteria bacterium]|nr:response regulator [Gammaproteobacteria bacterium]